MEVKNTPPFFGLVTCLIALAACLNPRLQKSSNNVLCSELVMCAGCKARVQGYVNGTVSYWIVKARALLGMVIPRRNSYEHEGTSTKKLHESYEGSTTVDPPQRICLGFGC